MSFENLGEGDIQLQTTQTSSEGGCLYLKGLVHCVSFKILFKIIRFVLINTKLIDGDERLEFIESMRTVQVVKREDGERWLVFPNPEKP